MAPKNRVMEMPELGFTVEYRDLTMRQVRDLRKNPDEFEQVAQMMEMAIVSVVDTEGNSIDSMDMTIAQATTVVQAVMGAMQNLDPGSPSM